jgi:predicted ribosomally synthesized peptide with SipW-like signal peptide
MKKKVLICALCVLVLLLAAAGGTLAYFTTESRARNVITTGTIDVVVTEHMLDDSGKPEAYPSEPVSIMPGTTVSKIVTVTAAENSASAWVRARIDVEIRGADGAVMSHTAEELSRLMTVACEEENWTEQDGWWYCQVPVSHGESTPVLFREVVFSGPDMTNEYQGGTVTVLVTAQAVQTAHNGDSAIEAAGWPAEPAE